MSQSRRITIRGPSDGVRFGGTRRVLLTGLALILLHPADRPRGAYLLWSREVVAVGAAVTPPGTSVQG